MYLGAAEEEAEDEDEEEIIGVSQKEKTHYWKIKKTTYFNPRSI